MQWLKSLVSIPHKLTLQPTRESLWAHRMSLATGMLQVKLQVGAFFIQKILVYHTVDAGHGAEGSCSLPVFLKVPACLGSLASSGWLIFVALAATRATAPGCCGGWRRRTRITAATFIRRALWSGHAWFTASAGACVMCFRLWFPVRESVIGYRRVFADRFWNVP